LPITFFSSKLADAQRNYTTIQKELLSIVETLTTYFNPFNFGSQLQIWTNHANMTYQNITLHQVLRWHLYIQEYGPTIHWKAGEDNIEADTLSCYPCLERQSKDEQPFYEELLLGSFLIYPPNIDDSQSTLLTSLLLKQPIPIVKTGLQCQVSNTRTSMTYSSSVCRQLANRKL
jgi:hypothetical protein